MTWVSREALEPWSSRFSWDSWCSSAAFDTCRAWGSWLARWSWGASNATLLHDHLLAISYRPFHTCVAIYLSWCSWEAWRTIEARKSWQPSISRETTLAFRAW